MPQTPLKIVALSGGLQRPSHTLVLVEELIEGIAQAIPVESRVIEIGNLVPQFGAVRVHVVRDLHVEPFREHVELPHAAHIVRLSLAQLEALALGVVAAG